MLFFFIKTAFLPLKLFVEALNLRDPLKKLRGVDCLLHLKLGYLVDFIKCPKMPISSEKITLL